MDADLTSAPDVFAMVAGRPFTEVPSDLFIPPDALKVLLDSFSGPLDLLLYLIRRQNIDILDIPISLITQQYMQYIQLLEERRLELAADYLVMAALLAEIKSKMLLPPDPTHLGDEIDDDPRMALVKRLQLYEVFKEAASFLDALPRHERDVFSVQLATESLDFVKIHPEVELVELVYHIGHLLQRQSHLGRHQITREPLSVRERMGIILQQLQETPCMELTHLFRRCEGRMGLVVTLLAILELSRQSLLVIMQSGVLAPIHVKGIEHA